LLSSSPALFLFGQRFLRQPRWLENLVALWNLGLRLEASFLPVTGRANELLIPGLKKRFGLRTLATLEPLEDALESRKIKALYVLGDLPLGKKPELLIVQNPFRTRLAEKADIFIPSATCLENTGPLVDLAGRIKKSHSEAQLPARKRRLEDVIIIEKLAASLGQRLGIEDYPGCLESILSQVQAGNRGRLADYLPLNPDPGRLSVYGESDRPRLPGELEVIIGENLDH